MKLDYIRLHSTVIIVGIIVSAIFLYLTDYLIFRNFRDTISSLIQGLAFIPIQLFLNTILINWVVEKQDEIKNSKKINVIIGVFFNENGNKILERLVEFDGSIEKFLIEIKGIECLEKECLEIFRDKVREYNPDVEVTFEKLIEMNKILNCTRDNMTNLLANSFLKDDDDFTEALMELIHLNDELNLRDLENLENYEMNHLKEDIAEAYKKLTIQWCEYMIHLYDFYPQLFNLAAIKAPFDKSNFKDKDKNYSC
ncbi:MAG: hypothetical protein ACRDD2_10745 [Sarcina sp.]